MGKIRVLIAEDNNLSQAMIRKLLTSCDQREFDITTVTDGKATLKFISENEIDILFLDVNMPKLSGLDVAKEMAHHKATKNKFITVAISANLNNANVIALQKLGVRYFVPKPFTKEKFAETVMPLLQSIS